MKIYLTTEQIELIEKRLDESLEEESILREKQKTESVNGWDFVALDNEQHTLKDILKNGSIDLDYVH
jgi:hypothetical protein